MLLSFSLLPREHPAPLCAPTPAKNPLSCQSSNGFSSPSPKPKTSTTKIAAFRASGLPVLRLLCALFDEIEEQEEEILEEWHFLVFDIQPSPYYFPFFRPQCRNERGGSSLRHDRNFLSSALLELILDAALQSLGSRLHVLHCRRLR